MARYTETKEFSFGNLKQSRLIVVKGQVSVDVWDSQGWVNSDNLSSGTAELFTSGARLRVTPAQDSSYYIDEGN